MHVKVAKRFSVTKTNQISGMILIKLFQSEAHHGDEASDEAEVREVVGVDGGGRVDLQTVVVFAGVFEQTVHGVQHLVGQQEEPLPAEPEHRRRLCRRGRCESV